MSTKQTEQTEGRGWHGDPGGHAEAGRKGGEAVSRDREHMAEIGRMGGLAHHDAASHHEAAAHHHRQAAYHHDEGDSETARRHASRAHEHSTRAHEHSYRAHQQTHGSSQRGGTHEQHVEAGRQSHKNETKG